MATLRTLLGSAALSAAAAAVPLPIGSFCDEQRDTVLAPDGSVVQQNNYTLCMDFDGAQWKTVGLGPSTGLFTGGVAYTIDPATKACTSNAIPGQGPPSAIPFSFLVLDDDSRGAAVMVGTAQIDGVTADHWQHNRTGAAAGSMNWYLLPTAEAGGGEEGERRNGRSGGGGDALLRTTFVGANGQSGSRDFARKWATPFAAGSFAVPTNCPRPSEAESAAAAVATAAMLQANAAFGDAVFSL
jgi:hypothetical protein